LTTASSVDGDCGGWVSRIVAADTGGVAGKVVVGGEEASPVSGGRVNMRRSSVSISSSCSRVGKDEVGVVEVVMFPSLGVGAVRPTINPVI